MTSTTTSLPRPRRHIIFIHLDLGIGGAEMLMLQLCKASYYNNNNNDDKVTIITSHCDQNHCFSAVKQPNGLLCNNVHVWGSWIPHHFGAGGYAVGTALCSTLRMLYMSLWVWWIYGRTTTTTTTESRPIVVLDVLPTSIPLLTTAFDVLFYCHFPDKLLVRNNNNNNTTTTTTQQHSYSSYFRHPYRYILNCLEEYTMRRCDVLVVNSEFTKRTVAREFPSLVLHKKPMHVLYPAFDEDDNDNDDDNDDYNSSMIQPIVSLNRFERKKNIELALLAYRELLFNTNNDNLTTTTTITRRHPLIIAGGYHSSVAENVQYMEELKELARELRIGGCVRFRPSISDSERTELLRTALCVLYTPRGEHFGIVPLEGMYRGRPVVAVRSGGPLETVADGETGFLCDDDAPADFARCLRRLVDDPNLAARMGRNGRERVLRKFGTERFRREWNVLLEECAKCGSERRRRKEHNEKYRRGNNNVILYCLLGALVILVVVHVVVTLLLRHLQIVQEDSHLFWGSMMKRAVVLWRRQGEEL